MNIFVLDRDPFKAAEYHCDKHVVKMILETAQILSTVLHAYGVEGLYKPTHPNHPCVKWAGETGANFNWTYYLGCSLLSEFMYRYDKIHASTSVINEAAYHAHKIPAGGLTPFALAMPEKYKTDCPVESYRNYYRKAKKDILTYRNREWPEWLLL